jgi:DNA-binding response OmpR family regulator
MKMKKNILIAEDDRSILEVVKLILENEGYTIISTDREQAIYEAIDVSPPDLILLDIWLAGEDGGVIAKNLKAKNETKHIPLIIMSANNETEKITKHTGADDFLLKPFNIDDLLQIVKKYISS